MAWQHDAAVAPRHATTVSAAAARPPRLERPHRAAAPHRGSLAQGSCACKRWGSGRVCGADCETRALSALCDPADHRCANQLSAHSLAREGFHARLGRGLFLKKFVRRGTVICKHDGRHTRAVTQRDLCTHMVLQLGKREWIVGTPNGGVSRFVNHSCEPNARLRVLTAPSGKNVVVIEALRDLKAGREVTVDYQWTRDAWFRVSPRGCICGKASCTFS